MRDIGSFYIFHSKNRREETHLFFPPLISSHAFTSVLPICLGHHRDWTLTNLQMLCYSICNIANTSMRLRDSSQDTIYGTTMKADDEVCLSLSGLEGNSIRSRARLLLSSFGHTPVLQILLSIISYTLLSHQN